MEPKLVISSHPSDEIDPNRGGNRWAHYNEPDMLAAQQFFNARRTGTLVQPEQALMRAVLQDAFESFQEHCAASSEERKQLFDDVQKWFFTGGSDWVFDFENICSVLGIDPDYLRKGLRQWRHNALTKHRRRARGKTVKTRGSGLRSGSLNRSAAKRSWSSA
jgi:hypothetical protein